MRTRERRVLTVFLAGAECPFTCLFCDLWQHTLPGSTPEGALPLQLEKALDDYKPIPAHAAIKLYNASNFFDRRAVPPSDLDRLAAACAPFTRVTVESHPRLLGDRCQQFSDALSGRLEIAMGLETIHPTVFPRLKDGMSLEDFEFAVRWAVERGLDVRAFVLVGLPWVPADDFAEWAVRSTVRALETGADRVSLIPLRADSGVLARLARAGELEPVSLGHLETALAAALEGVGTGGIVEAYLWDAERFAACPECAPARIARLKRINLAQRHEPAVSCACAAE